MKQTLFLATLLGATLGFSSISRADEYDRILHGNETLDLGGEVANIKVDVISTGNTMTNGRFIGTLTLESDSYLKSEAALATSTARATIVMKDGSTLEMAGSDLWIQDISKLSVEEGTATIKNGYLRVLPNTEFTLGNGVENLVGEGATNISLDNSTLILGDKTTNLNIIVWSAFGPSSTIRGDEGSKIVTSVSIITNSKLALQGVMIGDNASFTMGNNTQLDLGGASVKLGKVTLAEDATATVDNGTLWIGTGETVTLNPKLGGNYVIDLRGDATLDMGGQTRAFVLTVTGQENTLTNGAFTGNLTLAAGSTLVSDSAMASWDGPTSIVMNEGSTLEMVPGQGKDICINNPSALQVNGKATINNAYLVLRTMNRPNHEYVLDDGVASLEGSSSYLLPGDEEKERFNLNNHTANFGIIVWESDMASDISISNGTIDKSVLIRNTSGDQLNSKLSLRNVKLGDGAYFTMEDNTQLDLGQAKEEYMVTVQTATQTATWLATRNGIGLNKFTFTGQSARIDNGTLWVGEHISGDNETVTLGTDLSGTAAMWLDYDQATLKFGGHKWTMTQSNGTELFTMEDNGGYTGAITGRASIDVDSGTQDKNRVQFKGRAVDRPDWVQVQGVKLTTKSDFYMENAVISGSLIDIGEGTTMYLVNVEIKADTRFTDDTAWLDMRNTSAWLEQDVNTFEAGSETVAADTTLLMSGDKSDTPQSITMAAGSQVINLTCDMFDSVILTGTDLWLDMTDIAERGTLLGYGYVTIDFGHVGEQLGDVLQRAMVDARNLSVYAKLVDDKGQAYTERAYYDPATLSGDYAPRLFFKLVDTPEPTTGTLSLLALAALAARRRKK